MRSLRTLRSGTEEPERESHREGVFCLRSQRDIVQQPRKRKQLNREDADARRNENELFLVSSISVVQGIRRLNDNALPILQASPFLCKMHDGFMSCVELRLDSCSIMGLLCCATGLLLHGPTCRTPKPQLPFSYQLHLRHAAVDTTCRRLRQAPNNRVPWAQKCTFG